MGFRRVERCLDCSGLFSDSIDQDETHLSLCTRFERIYFLFSTNSRLSFSIIVTCSSRFLENSRLFGPSRYFGSLVYSRLSGSSRLFVFSRLNLSSSRTLVFQVFLVTLVLLVSSDLSRLLYKSSSSKRSCSLATSA